uniref:Uncharacterized protein n=1 Tax=Amphilophus citrinellus TaxID=61819 RepID=A0A3Q0SN65_AMPCI
MFCLEKGKSAFHHQNLIPTQKHDVGSIIALACFRASGKEWLIIIDGAIDLEFHHVILKKRNSVVPFAFRTFEKVK